MKKITKCIFSIVLTLTLIFGMLLPTYGESRNEAEEKATALKELGLFKGVSDTDFALDRAPTRTEALVMLIRALGKETEAHENKTPHPFTDVPSWADDYVGYGYEKGLTKGISATEFGGGNADSKMYLTFMLRALGYSDTNGDFLWSTPDALARAVGILTDSVNTTSFLRADAAIVSWEALGADLKGGSQHLFEKLIEENVFTDDAYAKAILLIGETDSNPVTVNSFEALKSALSNASTKSILIDAIGNPVIVTGELTIPAGVTVAVGRGSDFHVDGTLTNNGIINVMGADSITEDFINYSVFSVLANGTIQNKGVVNLEASSLETTDDHGPIGGQLRINGGTFTNKGSVLLKKGLVNTHGGMMVVINGTFSNDELIIVDGFFLQVDQGSLINNPGAVIINNSKLFAQEAGIFTNNGTITGLGVNE